MTRTFYFNITLHKEKNPHQSKSQEGRAAGGAVLTAQHLLEITASLLAAAPPPPAIVGRASTENLSSGSTGFQRELGKIQMGSASHERNSSICTSFKGTGRDREGLRSCSSLSHSPGKPREGVTSTPRALPAPFPAKFLETKDFQQEQPT